jgi:hypothetical protein
VTAARLTLADLRELCDRYVPERLIGIAMTRRPL